MEENQEEMIKTQEKCERSHSEMVFQARTSCRAQGCIAACSSCVEKATNEKENSRKQPACTRPAVNATKTRPEPSRWRGKRKSKENAGDRASGVVVDEATMIRGEWTGKPKNARLLNQGDNDDQTNEMMVKIEKGEILVFAPLV